MAAEARQVLTEPAVMRALAHPVRLDLLDHLMAHGTDTASGCARAVGDTPSNCSYHLRVLARHGLVAPDRSTDGRERPWRALITGFDAPPGDAGPDSEQARASAEFLAVSVQREQRMLREHVARRERLPGRWLDGDAMASYTLRMTPDEARELVGRLDAMIRPYLAATRTGAPDGAGLVHAAFYAFPQLQPDPPGQPQRRDAADGPAL